MLGNLARFAIRQATAATGVAKLRNSRPRLTVPIFARLSSHTNNILSKENKPFLTGNSIIEPDHSQITARFSNLVIQARQFHAAGSKIHYLDFRYRLKTHRRRSHLLIIRRKKMKKHQRRKFRRKFKSLLAKKRLKREIAKEKAFRVELLTIIRRAEEFDPKEYALRKLAELHDQPIQKTRQERLEELKERIRVNRFQTTYVKPKHRRADI